MSVTNLTISTLVTLTMFTGAALAQAPKPKPAPPTTAPAAKTKAPAKEVFAKGERIEVKNGSSWEPGTVRNRDGDLYLVVRDGWESQFFWMWAHVSGVRKPGSDKEGLRHAETVTVANSGVDKARLEAKKIFVGMEQKVAAAEAETAREREKAAADEAERRKRDQEWEAARKQREAAAGKVSAPTQKKEELPADGPWKSIDWSKADKRDAQWGEPLGVKPDAAAAPAAGIGARPVELKVRDALPRLGPNNEVWPDEDLHGPFFSSPEAARAAVGFQRRGAKGCGPLAVEWLDLKTGNSVAIAQFDAAYHLHDISPDGRRIVIGPGGDTSSKVHADAVQVWELGDDGKPKPVAFFKPFGSRSMFTNAKRGWFVDSDRLLVFGAFTEVALIDIAKAQGLWAAAVSVFAEPALSANRALVAVTSNDTSIVVLDTKTGQTVGRFGEKGKGQGKPAFSEDGKRLALGASDLAYVFDVASGAQLFAARVPSPAGADNVHFVGTGGRHLLLPHSSGAYLFDLAKQFITWSYGINAPRTTRSQVFAGRYWYVCNDRGTTLSSAVLPQPSAVNAAANVNAASMLVVSPGMSVALDFRLNGGGDAGRAAQPLTKRLTDGGLKVDANAPLKLVATSTLGKTTQVVFRDELMRESPRQMTDISMRLAYERDGQVLWQTTSEYLVSQNRFVALKKDQTLDQAIAEARDNALKFFETRYVPPCVQRRNGNTVGLGLTTLGSAGLAEPKAGDGLE
jgi:hypothetical protein